MEIKDIIKNRRLELGLTMKELAKKVGVSEGTISRWESGSIANMRRDRVFALAKALDIPIEIIMGWEEDKFHYLDPEAAEIAQEMHDRPELKTLFKTSRKVSADDLKMIQDMINRLAGDDD